MKRAVVLAALVAGLMLSVAPAAFAGGVTHHVSVGGPDVCADPALGLKPGCDANFSLVADQYADGTVKGEYTDRYKTFGGIHAVIDCLVVVGHEAWVSGVITSGSYNGIDLTNRPVGTRVKDNGTSVKDPPDQFSYSDLGPASDCHTRALIHLFDVPQGQVSVK